MNTNWTDDTVLQRSQAVNFDRLDDEFLGIDAQNGMCYSLNPTAHQVWLTLENPLSFGDLCRKLAHFYGADEQIIRADMPDLIRDLQKEKLVSLVETTPSGDAA